MNQNQTSPPPPRRTRQQGIREKEQNARSTRSRKAVQQKQRGNGNKPSPDKRRPLKQDKTATTKRDLDHRLSRKVLDLLRTADDLPTAYAALHMVQNTVDLKGLSRWKAGPDKDLIRQALLAVPYLLFVRVRESLERIKPHRAHEKVLQIFQRMGPRCCSETIRHQTLLDACPFLTRSEGWEILPILKAVGREARSGLSEIRRKVR